MWTSRLAAKTVLAIVGLVGLSGCAPIVTDSSRSSDEARLPPAIEFFASNISAITSGQSVTLSWSIAGADRVTIKPGVGVVQGTSVSVAPEKSVTYTLTASNGSRSTSAALDIAVLRGAEEWVISERPPELLNPTKVDMSKHATAHLDAWSVLCAGTFYRVILRDDEDAIVFMSGRESLRYPVHITGGHNVRILGLQIELETQPGCGIGELPNVPVDQHPNANIHPRVPGATALHLKQSGTSFVEGVYIDVRGHEADCFVSRNPGWMSGEQAREQRHVIIQNSTCLGNEGMGLIEGLGDGIHGDLFQNQVEALGRLVFENVTHRQSQNGVVLAKQQGFMGARELILRRFDYTWDRRYVGDDEHENFGLALDGYADSWTFQDVYIDDYRDGGDYVKINDQRYGSSPSRDVEPHPGIHSGLPSEGAFALPERTGVNYSSPHGNSQ